MGGQGEVEVRCQNPGTLAATLRGGVGARCQGKRTVGGIRVRVGFGKGWSKHPPLRPRPRWDRGVSARPARGDRKGGCSGKGNPFLPGKIIKYSKETPLPKS